MLFVGYAEISQLPDDNSEWRIDRNKAVPGTAYEEVLTFL
jgi:hypothetical protein